MEIIPIIYIVLIAVAVLAVFTLIVSYALHKKKSEYNNEDNSTLRTGKENLHSSIQQVSKNISNETPFTSKLVTKESIKAERKLQPPKESFTPRQSKKTEHNSSANKRIQIIKNLTPGRTTSGTNNDAEISRNKLETSNSLPKDDILANYSDEEKDLYQLKVKNSKHADGEESPTN